MNVFIGSSLEARPIAEKICDIIFDYEKELGIHPIPWWSNGLFELNVTIIESLFEILEKCDAAIFVFSEDDDIVFRDKEYKATRDNTVFEYGLFSGKLGRKKVAIAQSGSPKTLSDLGGVIVLRLIGNVLDPHFKERNRSKIYDWLVSLKNQHNQHSTVNHILESLTKLKIEHPEMKDQINMIVAILVDASIEDNASHPYMDKDLIDTITTLFLKDCKSILALDVVGPTGWTSTFTYKYLAPQLRQYLRMNIKSDQWHLLISQELKDSISTAISNAHRKGFEESLTQFDNPQDFKFGTGEYKLEFSRVLLWTKKELLTSVAESVIAIHEAFHVPLFYIETDGNSSLRDLDYILFKKNDSQNSIHGLQGRRPNYQTEPVPDKKAKKIMDEYMKLLSNKEIMFASDARELLIN